VGIYERFMLPQLIDLAMRQEMLRAAGTVLEIGIGSGRNPPYYSAAVSRLHGVDPSP
jgi:hypothetical protein